VEDDRPALRVLICTYVDGDWQWDVVSLQHWHTARQEYLIAGWWFIGVDPCDECDLARWQQLTRARVQ
jgi:hypothetical protein